MFDNLHKNFLFFRSFFYKQYFSKLIIIKMHILILYAVYSYMVTRYQRNIMLINTINNFYSYIAFLHSVYNEYYKC